MKIRHCNKLPREVLESIHWKFPDVGRTAVWDGLKKAKPAFVLGIGLNDPQNLFRSCDSEEQVMYVQVSSTSAPREKQELSPTRREGS